MPISTFQKIYQALSNKTTQPAHSLTSDPFSTHHHNTTPRQRARGFSFLKHQVIIYVKYAYPD